MTITPQIVNEIMAGKVHTCAHCGRLLFHKDNFPQESVQTA
jgi:predicted  nucleic acid-binding Zn-ribbon protein